MSGHWTLAAGHIPGLLGMATLSLCFAIALAEVYRGLRRQSRPRGAPTVALLRIVALATLAAMVFELTLRNEERGIPHRRVLVLVDDSQSMNVTDTAGEQAPRTRWDRLLELWNESSTSIERLRSMGIEVDLRTFSDPGRALLQEGESLPELPLGHRSNLALALASSMRPLGRSNTADTNTLAAVMVLSDGLIAEGDAERQQLDDTVAKLSSSPDIPIHTISLGAPVLRDISLTNLGIGEFAFVENITEFSIDILSHGYLGQNATVRILRDGTDLARKNITLPADGESVSVVFELAPERIGQFVYTIVVDGFEDEATLKNNRRSAVVKVLRDKVRALHVSGRPDWDVRALRTLLKRDPNVELLSYYILRDGEDVARDDENAPMSLIAFPTDAIFGSELGSFDLVILQNFDASQHGDYLQNIAGYVLEGGALVIVGGDLGLAGGEYSAPALAEVLPVDASRPAALETEPFRPLVSAAGRRHPITAWITEQGDEPWANLPRLDSYNRTPPATNPRISSTVLLQHPSAGNPPLLAVAEPGKGRSLVLSTGSSWRLGFAPDLPLIHGARPYDLLWLEAIRWLLHDGTTTALSLETAKSEYLSGESVTIRLQTVSPNYGPKPGVEIEWELRRLDTASDAETTPVHSGQWTSDASGRAKSSVDDLVPGAYEVRAWKSVDDGPSQSARRVFLVGGSSVELERVDARPGIALLRSLAKSTNGDFLDATLGDTISSTMRLADRTSAPPGALHGRTDIPLWDGWLALLLLLLAYPGEWLLRRRLGLA